jgi:organic radical activating enzyme
MRIPAGLYYRDGSVYIKKVCPVHGEFHFMVERSAEFFNQCAAANAPTIYGGYFIDVTKRCNLKCAHCYYPVNNDSKDIPINHIMANAAIHQDFAPFILTGGEPTLRQDLSEIISALQGIGPVELLTNGTGINDKNIDSLISLLEHGQSTHINMSIHPEVMADNLRVIELFRDRGKQLDGILWVIEDVSEIDNVIDFCNENVDVIPACRIKAATKVWNDHVYGNKIFVSDMLTHMESLGANVTWWRNNKVSFVTTELNGIYYMLVSWYDAFNIDVIDINCAPYYQALTGETMNILTAMVINEGVDKGFLNGGQL